uniref:Proteoglycan 4-like n=2 Tax=Panagrellus redivivus TaxID=6233 RepID=A0A7E4ZVT3_PANRE
MWPLTMGQESLPHISRRSIIDWSREMPSSVEQLGHDLLASIETEISTVTSQTLKNHLILMQARLREDLHSYSRLVNNNNTQPSIIVCTPGNRNRNRPRPIANPEPAEMPPPEAVEGPVAEGTSRRRSPSVEPEVGVPQLATPPPPTPPLEVVEGPLEDVHPPEGRDASSRPSDAPADRPTDRPRNAIPPPDAQRSSTAPDVNIPINLIVGGSLDITPLIEQNGEAPLPMEVPEEENELVLAIPPEDAMIVAIPPEDAVIVATPPEDTRPLQPPRRRRKRKAPMQCCDAPVEMFARVVCLNCEREAIMGLLATGPRQIKITSLQHLRGPQDE